MDDLNSLEEIRMEVEMCIAMANDDLEARKDDPPSTEDNTSSWVNKHARTSGAEGNVRSEAEPWYEDFPNDYAVRSEEFSEHSGNAYTSWNYSPLYPADPPVQSVAPVPVLSLILVMMITR